MNERSEAMLGPELRREILRILIAGAVVLCVWWIWPTRFGGETTVVVVQGTSMQPTFASGDLIVAHRLDHYSPGEIVVFRVDVPGAGHRLVVHRLLGIDPDGHITTRGDNRTSADGFDLTTNDIVGRAVLRVPKGALILRLLSRWWILAIVTGMITTAYLMPRSSDDSTDESTVDEPMDHEADTGSRQLTSTVS
ncbi:MAG TPA: signal peptidase I [Ilumatobacteraceae bacterium]|nr:signal peptidase I [Ilumatobacteraceae bacterium]